GANTTNASNLITFTNPGSTTGLFVGEAVSGTNIAPNTTVTAVDNLNNQVTISNPATNTGTNLSLTFGTAATGVATVDFVVTNVTVTNPGSGYTTTPSITFT